MNVPRRAVGHDTGFHSLPQPGQELSAKGAARLGYGSKNVKPFCIFTREKIGAPYTSQVANFITEVDHWEVRKDLQEGFVWKFKDYFHALAPAPTYAKGSETHLRSSERFLEEMPPPREPSPWCELSSERVVDEALRRDDMQDTRVTNVVA